jgi:hypothetical protein
VGQAVPVAVQVGAGAQALVGVPVQMLVQHSPSVPQAVPFWRQGLAQWFVASQNEEQQSPPAAQVSPFTEQGVAQTVPSQKPEQQSPATAQVKPSAVHEAGGWQVVLGVPEQRPVQHSPGVAQLEPVCVHGVAQWLVSSQSPEQQSDARVQAAGAFRHACAQWKVVSQYADVQSVAAAQTRPSAQVFPCATQAAPPQSTPVSVPFFQVSVQEGVEQTLPGLQYADVQSVAAVHARLFAHVLPSATQVAPPQSTAVSSPFFAPSEQVMAGGSSFGSQPLQPAESETASSAQSERIRLEVITPPTCIGMAAP